MVSAVYQVTCGVSTTLSRASSGLSAGDRLDGEHVETRGGEPPGAQRVDQRGLVDDRSARGVDQHGVALHQCQRRARRAGPRSGRSAAGAARRCRWRRAVRAAAATRGGRRRGCWCAARTAAPIASDDRLDAFGDVAVADQADGAARRCRAPSRRASDPTASPRLPGWPHPVRAAGAARRASAAPRPRRPTGRWRRACWRRRCRVAWRRRRRWCSPRRPACAPVGTAAPARGRRPTAAAGRARSHRPRAVRGRRCRRRPRRSSGRRANPHVAQPMPATLSPGTKWAAGLVSATAWRSTSRWYRPARCARRGW